MSEEEGVEEGVATIEYLAKKCNESNTELIIYLIPAYVAKYSPISGAMKRVGYKPPKIQSLLKVIYETRELGVPVYNGIWGEDAIDENGDFTCLEDYDSELRDAIKQFNETQDFALLEPYKNNL